MNRMAVARELVKAAKELTAMDSVAVRLENAGRLILSGGRGIELGIREIDSLARSLTQLHKDMRMIQSQEYREGWNQEGLKAKLAEELAKFV